jgi:hypothetical protein
VERKRTGKGWMLQQTACLPCHIQLIGEQGCIAEQGPCTGLARKSGC